VDVVAVDETKKVGVDEKFKEMLGHLREVYIPLKSSEKLLNPRSGRQSRISCRNPDLVTLREAEHSQVVEGKCCMKFRKRVVVGSGSQVSSMAPR
jgi:hypothetical protein